MSRSLIVWLVSSLVIVGSPVAYFATRPEPEGPVGMSPRQTTLEYRSEAAALRLAPGWRWPRKPVRDRAPDGRGVMYEPGWGKQAADFYWYCSWTNRATDPRVAAPARRRALGRVLAIREKYYYRTALAPVSKPAFDQVLASAELGDLTPLRRDYALNCAKA